MRISVARDVVRMRGSVFRVLRFSVFKSFSELVGVHTFTVHSHSHLTRIVFFLENYVFTIRNRPFAAREALIAFAIRQNEFTIVAVVHEGLLVGNQQRS